MKNIFNPFGIIPIADIPFHAGLLCVCVCVCVCVRVCVLYRCMYICTCMYMFIYVGMCVYIYTVNSRYNGLVCSVRSGQVRSVFNLHIQSKLLPVAVASSSVRDRKQKGGREYKQSDQNR